MATKYQSVDPVGQYDENACWAACLEWWLRAANPGNIVQDDVFEDYPLLRDTNGTIIREGLIQLIDDPRWYMKRDGFYHASHFKKSKLKKLLKDGPVYIGYYDQNMATCHVTVIHGIAGNLVHVMEPHFSPGSGDAYNGKHITRNFSYYNFTGEVFLGTPRAYTTGYDESYYS